ncbi:hypothetical protein GMW39_15315 [Pectobacterium parmentieri]|uniref:Uncharacterized protein n=1 Tax=Pectobacterium parvum TaxID=2778550 RepID=A0AAP9IDG6_9GAMM|nr:MULTISPECIES: hypothetical protein [Pectobacterium]QHQ17084.1 hypothetical protein GMW39_15315 [Pectobacterium parmentieri]QHQ22870.1 hypothetical protein GMX10_01260 [Pectobacterium parvum]
MSTTQNLGFKDEEFLYVGGSASAPLTINRGDSLVFENPYAGKAVTFIPQAKITSNSDSVARWIDVIYIFESNIARGVNVTVTSDGKIGVLVAANAIIQNVVSASGVPSQLLPAQSISSTLFRLRVI